MESTQEKPLKKQDPKAEKTKTVPKLRNRFSPAYILRSFCDSYVKSCLSAGDSAPLRSAAQAAVGFQVCEGAESLSRASSRRTNDDGLSSPDPHNFSSRQSSRRGSSASFSTSGRQQGVTMPVDALGYSSSLARSSRSNFDTVPESEELYTDTQVSKTSLDNLFQAASLPPSEFLLRSPSRRVAALEELGDQPTLVITRGGSERRLPPRSSSRFAARSLSDPTLSAAAGEGESKDSPRLTKRQQRLLKRADGADDHASQSLAKLLALKNSPSRDPLRANPKKSDKPNPYKDYDTRRPRSPANLAVRSR